MHTSAIETQAGWNAGVGQVTFLTYTPNSFAYLIPTFKDSFAQQMDPINSE